MIEDEEKVEEMIKKNVLGGETTTDINVILAQVIEALLKGSDRYTNVERDGTEVSWDVSRKAEVYYGDKELAQEECEKKVKKAVNEIKEQMEEMIPNFALK